MISIAMLCSGETSVVEEYRFCDLNNADLGFCYDIQNVWWPGTVYCSIISTWLDQHVVVEHFMGICDLLDSTTAGSL